MRNYRELLKNIDTFIFDYDGVLTDGIVILVPDGDALRTAYVRDGYALQLAVKKGYHVAIISGGYSKSMQRRFEILGIRDFFMGVANKLEVFHNYLAVNNLDPSGVLYMGDDIPDFPVMKEVGLPCCPADASPEIQQISLFISAKKGGRGCVRDIIEQVLKVKGHWMDDEAFHW